MNLEIEKGNLGDEKVDDKETGLNALKSLYSLDQSDYTGPDGKLKYMLD